MSGVWGFEHFELLAAHITCVKEWIVIVLDLVPCPVIVLDLVPVLLILDPSAGTGIFHPLIHGPSNTVQSGYSH